MKSFSSDPLLFNALERDILAVLWEAGEARSRPLHLLLGHKHHVTHTAIAVALNRLRTQGILLRRPEKARGGTRFVYRSRYTREELGTHIGSRFLHFLRKNFGDACVANLKESL